MAKWADYVITCVNYTADESKIATVGVRVGNGNTLEKCQTWHRSQVVKKLGEKNSFVTATKGTNGKWQKGAAVERYVVDGEWFIKTVANKKAKDNLGELPECSQA